MTDRRRQRVLELKKKADGIQTELNSLKDQDAGHEVDELATEYMEEHNCTYGEAMIAVCKADPDLAEQYLPKRR